MTGAVDEREEQHFRESAARLEQKQRALRGENVVPIGAARAAKADRKAEETPAAGDWRGMFEARVEPGRYIAAFVGYRTLTAWRRSIWLCAFKIIDLPLIDDPSNADRQQVVDARRAEFAPFLGLHVPRFINVLAKTTRPAMRSNFARDWRHVTGRRAPRNLASFTPAALYSNCSLEVEMVDVVKDSDQLKLHDDDRYSVIRRVIKLRDGSPPCMRAEGR